MKKSAYVLETGALSDKPKTIEWRANKTECEELAMRLGIFGVNDFKATITAERDNLIRVCGNIKANIVQSCVITGEPVEEKIDEDFEEFFTDNKRYKVSVDIDMDSPDITPVENNRIDLAELATQYLILFMNPYPHKQNAVFEDKIEDEGKASPFAVLEKLKH